MSEHLLTSSNNSTENEAEHSSRAVRDVIIGDCLIFAAQTVAAAQFVLEDKYVGGLDIPALEAVGYEGMFGVIMLGLLLIPFNFIKVPKPFSDNSRGTMEDVVGACVQIKNNLLLIVPLIGLIISVAFFNFTGITVTKEFSATTRMVLDSLRTLIIYLFSLAVTWQKFYWLQIPGFILLVFGTLMYNNAFLPLFNCCKAKRAARRESAAKPQENASSTEE
ncbi:solute carrier family 35 member F6-like [Periplaneta americana]|uniref:solute carrier family 35 member F6-like n=1 Tax=Periplaneta americana TaxID=6978 RepID=UPI0037E8F590